MIINEHFRFATGEGIEFGVLYSFKEIFSIGLVGSNLGSTQIEDYISLQSFLNDEVLTLYSYFYPLDLSLGIFWRPQLGRLNRYISNLRLMVDYHDMFNFLIYPPRSTKPLLHIGVGCELLFLEIVYLRAGFYQCLPNVRLGIDLSLFTLNMAIFGRELSREPGGNPIYGYMIGMEFR